MSDPVPTTFLIIGKSSLDLALFTISVYILSPLLNSPNIMILLPAPLPLLPLTLVGPK